MVFARNAIVYWIPRSNLKTAAIMFFRFALGDAEAELSRPKVMLIFARYAIALSVFALYILTKQSYLIITLLVCLALYILWAIAKNYKYVKDPQAYFLLPLLQFTSDAAVLSGTSLGVLKRLMDN